MESIGTEWDSSVKPEGEEDTESSEGENQETLSDIGGADHLISCIICFANVIKVYQKENQNCFRCGSPDHLGKDCPKDLSKVVRKVSLNTKEQMMKKGGQTPQKPVVAQLASPDEAPRA